MTNTARSFDDKWRENPRLAFAETLREGSDIQQWILNRNGFSNLGQLRDYLSDRRRILDAGCGNGRVTALLRIAAPADAQVVGFDLVAAEVARENLRNLPNVTVAEGNLLADLTAFGTFDFIYCQEVLHHTGNPRAAFLNVATLLAPNGELAIYVYRLKAPIREFVDNYVRDRIVNMPYEKAFEVCAEITALGKALSDVKSGSVPLRIDVPGVRVLGIDAGEYDLQRFIYHFFMKCFWNRDLTTEENIAINYDWYHPQDATRHELSEVLGWFSEAELAVTHSHIDPYGITVRGRRGLAKPRSSRAKSNSVCEASETSS